MNSISGKITPIVGESDFTQNICNLIHGVSKNSASVLLLGERGTGKRLIAQHIFYEFCADSETGIFNKKDFYEINCKSFIHTDILMVFDAVKKFVPVGKKIVLFVNFINLLSEQLQEALLDVINTAKNKGISLKVVCSSEENLEELVLNKSFLPALFYQINAIVLNTVPLRLRKEDILPIAEYYRELFKKQSGLNYTHFSDEAKIGLQNQFWKGNIDELINGVQKAFLVGNEPVIKSLDLGIFENSSTKGDVSGYGLEDKTLKGAVDAFKKDYVTRILEENNWNQTKTAKILGIQRTYVIKLINELGIKK